MSYLAKGAVAPDFTLTNQDERAADHTQSTVKN